MSRRLLLVLCSTVALAQVRPPDPFEIARRSYSEARSHGGFEQAAALRESARALVAQTPIDSPDWLGRVHTAVQMYRSSERRLQAHTVIEEQLSRAAALGDSHPFRIQLWNMLADSLQQDGSLLKALPYREKAAAAQEALPAAPPAGGTRIAGNFGGIQAYGRLRMAYSGSANTHIHQQLAQLYRELGHPEAAAKMTAKVRSLLKDNPMALASSYEQEGDLDQAIALYRKLAEQGPSGIQANPWESIRPLQSLANVYQHQKRLDEAAAALVQAAARLEASGRPEERGLAVGMRLNIADMLEEGGRSQEADRIYQALVPEIANDRHDMGLSILQSYGRYLSRTDRASQAEVLLKGYLTNHANLQPWEESNLLMTLSQIARSSGRKELAEEYQRTAMEKQRVRQPQLSFTEGPLIAGDLQKAQEALNRGNLDEAVNLALHAVASAWRARDGDQVASQVPQLAIQLAIRKAPDKGETLFRQLMPVLEARAVDHAAPLLQAMQQYPRFLMVQKDRWAEAPAAIDRYRESVAALQGEEGGQMAQVLQLRIEFAQRQSESAAAVQPAEALLAFEESRSGSKSAPYMRAAQTAVGVFQSSGNLERALALHREIVAIGDTTLRADDPQLGYARINAAMAYAQARRFDEAERLAAEAVAFGERTGDKSFASQIDQIRMMKRAAESAPVQGGERWFRRAATPQAPPPPAKGVGSNFRGLGSDATALAARVGAGGRYWLMRIGR